VSNDQVDQIQQSVQLIQ